MTTTTKTEHAVRTAAGKILGAFHATRDLAAKELAYQRDYFLQRYGFELEASVVSRTVTTATSEWTES